MTKNAAPAAERARLYRALGEPSRLAILEHLATGEHRVCDLVEHLGMAQSTVSKHLACLVDCGLVAVRSAGRSSWHALAAPEALAAVGLAVDRLVAETGGACGSVGEVA